MAPGHFNGTNFGGLHTGTGKYQNGGPYANNGYRHKLIPNREFSEGKRVAYVGSHKDFYGSKGDGIIVSKSGDKQRTARSLVKVRLEDGRRTYFHKKSLVFV